MTSECRGTAYYAPPLQSCSIRDHKSRKGDVRTPGYCCWRVTTSRVRDTRSNEMMPIYSHWDVNEFHEVPNEAHHCEPNSDRLGVLDEFLMGGMSS